MDELTLDGKVYISSKRSAQITGYAKDYIGQLCREGRVAARLVGRNWYVLESSIREHRFGPTEAPAVELDDSVAEKEPEDAWKASNYVSETVSEMPVIASSVTADATPAIEEMQSAWHDWFSRTNELRRVENPIESTVDDLELVEESHIEAEEEEETIIEESVMIDEKVDEEEEVAVEEEEIVPIRRTFATPARSVLPISTPRAIYTPLEVNPNYVRRDMPVYVPPVPEGRIIRERRVMPAMPKKKSNLVLQTLFILVAIVAAGVGVIGSGKIDTLISQSVSRYSPIQYVAGVSSFQRVSK